MRKWPFFYTIVSDSDATTHTELCGVQRDLRVRNPIKRRESPELTTEGVDPTMEALQ